MSDNQNVGTSNHKVGLFIRLAIIAIALVIFYGSYRSDPAQNSSAGNCQPLNIDENGKQNRPLRVGITRWAGFAGGLMANHGMASEKVKFLLKEGYKAREAAFSCSFTNADENVDIIWSSLESWSGEYPNFKDLSGQAILQVAKPNENCALVADKEIDESKLTSHKLGAPLYSPADWIAHKWLDDKKLSKDVLQTEDSPQDVLDKFQGWQNGKRIKKEFNAVVLCEPELAEAKKVSNVTVLSSPTDVTYILIAHQQIPLSILREFVSHWLKGNTKAVDDSSEAARLTLETRKLRTESRQVHADEEGRVRNELAGARFASFQENRKTFGSDGRIPQFYDLFKASSKIWRPHQHDSFTPAEAMNAQPLSLLENSLKGTPFLCRRDAHIKEIGKLIIDFPYGSAVLSKNAKQSLDDLAGLMIDPASQACISASGTQNKNNIKQQEATVRDELRDENNIAMNRIFVGHDPQAQSLDRFGSIAKLRPFQVEVRIIIGGLE